MKNYPILLNWGGTSVPVLPIHPPVSISISSIWKFKAVRLACNWEQQLLGFWCGLNKSPVLFILSYLNHL